jgi:uncharacterized sporulation protein YeaH/YhbH (DUF444 family)
VPRRVEEDFKHWRDLIGGRFRKQLRKYVKTGQLFPLRGKNGKLSVPVHKLDLPHFRYGDPTDGVGRGPGNKGDIVGRDPQGQGQGQGAGQGEGEGIEVQVDMEDVIKILGEELSLPDLKPKPNETFEEIKYKYNDIAMTGPESLRHNRRTMLQALKRMASTGEIDELHKVPGVKDPIRLIKVINPDRRYRQYKPIKIPSSNAVVFFMRDWSGSMDDEKCNIVSDMAYWIDLWVRAFYKKVETVYIGHDNYAEEVSQERFYKFRGGGGTTCSSALKLMAKQFENRFPPNKWNIYGFYFSDGDNWGGDDDVFCESLEKDMPPNIVNMFGMAQVLSYSGGTKEAVDDKISAGKMPNVRTTAVGDNSTSSVMSGHWGAPKLSSDERNDQIRKAIKELLGPAKVLA